MDTMYKTYERFIEAAKKFPRWNNIRRRPTKSVGGKILRSVVEEIGKVEDAIIEYKKDFFLVNYIGKEDNIIAYLYNAMVGEVTPENIFFKNEELYLTTDIQTLYKDKNAVYYQDGYFILRYSPEGDSITYHYYFNGKNNDDENPFSTYTVKIEKFHVWNVFDEFAWWSGIERLTDESNKELLTRTINQFRNRPNSSKKGLKNVIKNVLSNYGNIDDDEIKFETPNQENMKLFNDDGETLYEEISKFNRDIARTKRWDIDNWDNSFRTLHYLPHEWDAKVEVYRDGVGYDDSLFVSTVKDLDIENTTDIQIHGYKKSQEKIEEYITNENISKDIKLDLVKYSNEVNPVPIQYKITASTLTHISKPDKIFIDSYVTSNSQRTYMIDDIYEGKEDVDVKARNYLEPNKKYTLKFLPKTDGYATMEIMNCDLRDNETGTAVNLLKEKGNFGYNERNLFVNKGVLLHVDKITDFNSSTNLEDYRYGGITLTNLEEPAYFELDISGLTSKNKQIMKISSECELDDISFNPTYVTTKGFTLIDDKYISDTSMVDESNFVIELDARTVEFELEKIEDSLSNGYVNIETYVNGKMNNNFTYYNLSIGQQKKLSFKLDSLKHVKIIIKRNTATAIKVHTIKASRYDFSITTSNGSNVVYENNGYTIPIITDENSYLYVTINNYGKHSPIINCIHIGNTLMSVIDTYQVEIDTTGLKNPYLDINSNCHVDLYNTGNGKKSEDFNPNNLYINNTQQYQALFLDLSSFKNIYYSEPKIKYSSNNRAYIELKPEQHLDSIVIYGQSELLQSRTTLKDAINVTSQDTIFVNENIKGFIKRTGDKEEVIELTELMCSKKEADTYNIWSNEYPNLKVCYISNLVKNTKVINNRYSGHFENAYLYDKDTSNYVAYNIQNIIKEKTKDISIIKNFLPAIPSGERVLYRIEQPTNASVLFEDGNDWSTTISKRIAVETNISLTDDTVKKELKEISKKFILSNNIPLNDVYEIDNEFVELGQYMISLPEGLKIIYEDTDYVQTSDDDGNAIYAENDGFNKLLHSNVIEVKSVKAGTSILDKSSYSIISEPGIICWNDESIYGSKLEIRYSYKKPKYIAFDSIDLLYKLVNYNLETFVEVETIDDYIVKDLKAGSSVQINWNCFVEKPEKLIIKCSNPCYSAVINNDLITVTKIGEDNSIVIHNGYYYIDGKEYWMFSNKQDQTENYLKGVEMNNVSKLADRLQMQMESTNYLKNAKMNCDLLKTHCIVSFKNKSIDPSISSLEHMGSCDSFSSWHSYKMNVSLGDTHDGQVINFTSNNESSYAILDITKAIRDCNFLSCHTSGSLKTYLGREKLINEFPLAKSLYVEVLEDLKVKKDKMVIDCRNLDHDHRYYLIVKGSGTLIEVIASKTEDVENDHTKAISKLGINIAEELDDVSTIEVDFSPTGMKYENLEIDKSMTIGTGTSVDWGITKIKDYDLINETKMNGFLYRNEILTANTDTAWIETNPVKLDYINAISNLIFKINDFHEDERKNFKVTVYVSNSSSTGFNEIGTYNNVNLIQIPSGRLMNYVKFKIYAEKNKTINHLESFVIYTEDEDTVRVSSYSQGSCITKIFDLGRTANFRLKSVDYVSTDKSNIDIHVRGLRFVDDESQYTDWYLYNQIDNHIFQQYRYFQFRITINDQSSKIKINKFIFEVL